MTPLVRVRGVGRDCEPTRAATPAPRFNQRSNVCHPGSTEPNRRCRTCDSEFYVPPGLSGRPVGYCSEDCRKEAIRRQARESYYRRRHAPQTPIVFGDCDECGRYHARNARVTMHSFVQAGGILRCHPCAIARKKARKLERERERRAEYRDAGDPRYEQWLASDTAKNHARRVWSTSHESDLTKDEIRRLKKRAKHCAMCGCKLSKDWRERHLDHVIPRAAGGTHTRDNVRILCVACNCSRPHDASDVSNFQLNIWMVQDAV